MSVVLNGEAEVPLLRIAGAFEDILPGSHQLDDRQGKIGKVIRIGSLTLYQKLVERFGIRIGGKLSA